MAFVKIKNDWYGIDTMGAITSQLGSLEAFEHTDIFRKGNVLFARKDISTRNPQYSYAYGFMNTANKALIAPVYHDIDINGFSQDLIHVAKDGLDEYINQAGRSVWQQRKTSAKNEVLNIDFMNRGYFYASSKYKKELAGYGGWGHSENEAKPLSTEIDHSKKALQLVATDEKKEWFNYEGKKILVANTSTDTLYFSAQDSRLYMKIQAKDKKGEWRDIEYLPSSWCGNSYHTLFLAPGQGWEFSSPAYHGEFKTKLRAQLMYQKSFLQKSSDIIYSNEFDGSINPGQFWNKREYYPGGIMDPYND